MSSRLHVTRQASSPPPAAPKRAAAGLPRRARELSDAGLGHDFRDVRVHADGQEAASPQARASQPAAVDLAAVMGDTVAAHVLGRVSARRIRDAAGSARGLAPRESSELERRFGPDLPDVRVHDGVAARDAATLLGARAFTVGRDIYLGSARPSDALLAHEVAHTIQQRDVGSVTGTIALVPSSSPSEYAAASGSQAALAPASAPAVQRDEDPDKERLFELLKDPEVVKRVAQALKKGRDVSGVLNEELLNVEVRSRLTTGQGLEDILPKGRTAENVTFVPGHEIWTVGGRSFTDGLFLDTAQLNRALNAADAQAAAAKGKAKRQRPTAPPEMIVDARAFFEAKAGRPGARKLAAKGEDTTKMPPKQIQLEHAEHAKVVQESAEEAAAGESPGDVIKTDIGGQVGEVYERAMHEGHLDVVVQGRKMRIRFSRHTTAILAVPAGIDLTSEITLLGRHSRDVRTLTVPTTEKALKEVAEQIKTTGVASAEASPAGPPTHTGTAEPATKSVPETVAAESAKSAAEPPAQLPSTAEPESSAAKSAPAIEPELVRGAFPTELHGMESTKGGVEGGAMNFHNWLEGQAEGFERQKEKDDFESKRRSIQRALDAGRWVYVTSIWVKTRVDPFSDMSGFHDADTLPQFLRIEWTSGSSPEEALHPGRAPAMLPDTAGERPPLPPSPLEGHPEKFYVTEQYASFAPATQAQPKKVETSTVRHGASRKRPMTLETAMEQQRAAIGRHEAPQHPDPNQLAGEYGGVADPPHAFSLTPYGGGLRIRWARSTSTWNDYSVAAQNWKWYGAIGVLQSTLVDPRSGERIESTLTILVNPAAELIGESFTVSYPDGRAETTFRTPRRRTRAPGEE
jgi:Domain of unknown function (DUF4157)